jgi:hypothetical protein
MRVENQTWTIEKLQEMESKINPQPQYQRSAVWNLAAKQLLIDSILCKFDIPKIYLTARSVPGIYEYDVTDGQQRMRAIWAFLRDEFPLAGTSYRPDAPWRNCTFANLFQDDRDHIMAFPLIIAVISDATSDEVRELFSRLQRGVRLNSAELRNSMPSQIGDAIRSIADSHIFFTGSSCKFADTRFQHRELCALAFAVLLYKGEKDLKAPNLKQMYTDYARSVPEDVPGKAMKVLDLLQQVHTHSGDAVKTKWGYVDLCFFLSQHLDEELDTAAIGIKYAAFEKRRRLNTATPETLLEGGNPSASAKRLFTYIEAFKTSGAVAKNVRQRQETFAAELRVQPARKKKTRK